MHAKPRGYHQARICDKDQQSEDGDEYKGRLAHLNQEHMRSRRCYQTTTNASNISHIPTSTGALHRCIRYERNASQVNVISGPMFGGLAS